MGKGPYWCCFRTSVVHIHDFTDYCWAACRMLSLVCLHFFVEWHQWCCFGWLCASVGHGLWTKATSRLVIRVPSASKCKIERNHLLYSTYHDLANYKKTPTTYVYSQLCPLNRRQRALKPGESPYRALLETMELTNTKLTLQLINDKNKVTLILVERMFTGWGNIIE